MISLLLVRRFSIRNCSHQILVIGKRHLLERECFAGREHEILHHRNGERLKGRRRKVYGPDPVHNLIDASERVCKGICGWGLRLVDQRIRLTIHDQLSIFLNTELVGIFEGLVDDVATDGRLKATDLESDVQMLSDDDVITLEGHGHVEGRLEMDFSLVVVQASIIIGLFLVVQIKNRGPGSWTSEGSNTASRYTGTVGFGETRVGHLDCGGRNKAILGD